jgi:FMN phosphatase YigB (HAD superfamily)
VSLVTIDFHNTLFRCDDWFRLEIEELPIAVLDELSPGEIPDQDITHLKCSARAIYQRIRKQAMATGVECDAVTSINMVARELELDTDPQTLESAVESVMYRTVDAARPRSGAVELVGSLAAREMSLAVVSSAAYHPFLEWCLERFEMRSAFDHVVTSAACGIYKSDPAIYQHTLDLFSAPAEGSVHIGDSHRFDVTSASKIGFRTILLTDDPDLDYDPEPDAVITSLGDATDHLDRLLGNSSFTHQER